MTKSTLTALRNPAVMGVKSIGQVLVVYMGEWNSKNPVEPRQVEQVELILDSQYQAVGIKLNLAPSRGKRPSIIDRGIELRSQSDELSVSDKITAILQHRSIHQQIAAQLADQSVAVADSKAPFVNNALNVILLLAKNTPKAELANMITKLDPALLGKLMAQPGSHIRQFVQLIKANFAAQPELREQLLESVHSKISPEHQSVWTILVGPKIYRSPRADIVNQFGTEGEVSTFRKLGDAVRGIIQTARSRFDNTPN